MPKWIEDNLFTLIFGLFGAIFLLVGGGVLWFSLSTSRQVAQTELLPVIATTAQLRQTSAGTEAVFEARISERNKAHYNNLVAYVRYQYRGERCTNDDDGRRCEPVWVENERITPPLWLDLPEGRLRLANDNYQVQAAPISRQIPEALIEGQTVRYEGFNIGSPVFIGGTVGTMQQAAGDGPQFVATFLAGGTRDSWLAGQRESAAVLFWLGFAFAAFGVVFAGLSILFGVVLGK